MELSCPTQCPTPCPAQSMQSASKLSMEMNGTCVACASPEHSGLLTKAVGLEVV